MRLDAKTIGDIRRNLRKETEFISRLATKATKEATNGLKAGLRNDVVGSGFGVRLSRTWRSKIYDDNGVDVKGFVYSRAPQIIESFDQAQLFALVTDGIWLFPRRMRQSGLIGGSQHRICMWSTKGICALFAATAVLPFWWPMIAALLTAAKLESSGFRKASKRALRTGKGLTTVVMFILVPTAKMPKKLDVQKVADQWGIKHIDLMVSKYR